MDHVQSTRHIICWSYELLDYVCTWIMFTLRLEGSMLDGVNVSGGGL